MSETEQDIDQPTEPEEGATETEQGDQPEPEPIPGQPDIQIGPEEEGGEEDTGTSEE